MVRIPEGGRIRVDGRIQKVPTGWREREIPFSDKTRHALSIPWGDVSTAYYTTGIGNIITYLAMPPNAVKAAIALSKLGPLLALNPVQRGLKKLVEMTVKGPDEEARQSGRSEIWGEVRNAAGKRVTGTLTTPEGYQLTADSCVRAVQRVLAGIEPGAATPSMAFGSDYVTTLDGVTVHPFVESSS